MFWCPKKDLNPRLPPCRGGTLAAELLGRVLFNGKCNSLHVFTSAIWHSVKSDTSCAEWKCSLDVRDGFMLDCKYSRRPILVIDIHKVNVLTSSH